MAGRRFTTEQLIMKLREAEVGLAQGQRGGARCLGVSGIVTAGHIFVGR